MPSPHAKRASDLFDARDYAAAIEAYTLAIRDDPSNANLYSDRGAAKNRLNDIQGALADYAEAVRVVPRHVQARMNAGFALKQLERWAEAAEAYEAAMHYDPSREAEAYGALAEMAPSLGKPPPIPRIADIRACLSEANEAEKAGDHKKALAAYDRAIGIDGRLASVFVSRALAHKALGDHASGLADLDRAISMRGEWANAYLERGMMKSAAGNLQGADDDAAAAARIDPKFVWAYNNRASALHRMKRYEDAIAQASKAISIDPSLALAYVNRALACEGLQRHEDALADYRKACSLDPLLTRSYRGNQVDCQFAIALRSRHPMFQHAKARYDAGVAAAEAKNHAKAIEEFTAAITLVPDVPAFHVQRGLVKMALGQNAEAADDFRGAADLWPGFANAWSNLASSLLEQKKLDEALDAAESGLALDPDGPYLNTWAGRALAAKGNHKKAVAHFDRAILHLPDVPGVHWSRALARWETQDWQGTIDDMKAAVERDPSMRAEAEKWIPVAQQKLQPARPAAPAPERTVAPPSPNAPPSEVPNHGGESHAADLDFFVDPPSDIGSLLSAHSTLNKGVQPTTLGKRILYLVLFAVGGLVLGIAIDIIFSVENEFWYVAWPVGLPLLGAIGSWSSTKFDHTCTYVGRLGIARFQCKKRRDNLSRYWMRFQEATELRTSSVRRYTNGVYQGTDYVHTWSDAKGAARFVISGKHHAEKKNPPATDNYMFALAAEQAWSNYLLDRADDELNRTGCLHFSISGKDYVRVAPQWIELCIGGKQERRDAGDFASISLKDGKFTIKTKDAKGWFFKTGVFSFDYGKMANVRLFILALDKLAGLPVH